MRWATHIEVGPNEDIFSRINFVGVRDQTVATGQHATESGKSHRERGESSNRQRGRAAEPETLFLGPFLLAKVLLRICKAGQRTLHASHADACVQQLQYPDRVANNLPLRIEQDLLFDYTTSSEKRSGAEDGKVAACHGMPFARQHSSSLTNVATRRIGDDDVSEADVH